MFNNAKVCLLCGSKMPCWDKKCKKRKRKTWFPSPNPAAVPDLVLIIIVEIIKQKEAFTFVNTSW